MTWTDHRPHDLRNKIATNVGEYFKKEIVDIILDKNEANYYSKLIKPHHFARMVEQNWQYYNRIYFSRGYKAEKNGLGFMMNKELQDAKVFFVKDEMTITNLCKPINK